MSHVHNAVLSGPSHKFRPHSDRCPESKREFVPIVWDVLTAFQHVAAQTVSLVDARSPASFLQLRIPAARNVPLETIGTAGAAHRMADLNANSDICVYGAAGASSRKAAAKLLEFGYRKVYYLDGGFLAWEKKGLPCVTEIDGELVRVVTERVGLTSPVYSFR